MSGGMLSNAIIVIPACVWVITQLIKMLIRWMDPKFDRRFLMSSGGMPSVHAAFMTSLTTAVAFKEGLYATITVVTICITAVVLYDAMNIRYEGGRHAKMLNTLSKYTPGMPEFLKEHLGHKPTEVLVGGILGILLATGLYFL